MATGPAPTPPPSLGAPPRDERKATGSYETPPAIVRFMCGWALRTPVQDAGEHWRALDLATGTGAFLLGLADELAGLGIDPRIAADMLHGVELRPEAAAAARRRLHQATGSGGEACSNFDRQIWIGDALLDPAPGTFDLVIGNPPYLGNRYFEALMAPAAYRARLREAFGWNDDLYVHFVVRSFGLARPGGVICLITPDTYLATPAKRRLRRFLLDRRLLGLVLLSPGLFDAHVYPAILLARNEPAGPDDRIEVVDARRTPPAELPALLTTPTWLPVHRWLEVAEGDPRRTRVASAVYHRAPDCRIYFPSVESLRLAELVAAVAQGPGPTPGQAQRPAPTPTGSLARKETRGVDALRPGALVPLGLVAPARDVGIHSGNVRHHLFFRDPVRPGLARLLQGCQIGRYLVCWDTPAARYRYVDLGYQPDPTRPGRGRGGRPSRRGEYWHLRGDRRHHVALEKILVRQTEDDLVAAYLRQEDVVYYTDNTLFTILIQPAALAAGISYRYLLALLNSATLGAIYHFLAQEAGKAQAQVRVDYLNRLPILVPTAAERETLEALAEDAIQAGGKRSVLDAVQTSIDQVIGEQYAALEREGCRLAGVDTGMTAGCTRGRGPEEH